MYMCSVPAASVSLRALSRVSQHHGSRYRCRSHARYVPVPRPAAPARLAVGRDAAGIAQRAGAAGVLLDPGDGAVELCRLAIGREDVEVQEREDGALPIARLALPTLCMPTL